MNNASMNNGYIVQSQNISVKIHLQLCQSRFQALLAESLETRLQLCSGVAKARPGRAWPGTCPAKVHLARVCASASVASAMVKLTASAQPIPMTWLRHCSYA